MAIRALWINCVGFVVLIIMCSFAGLVIYAKYHDCDPVSSKIVSKADQILPYFVMDVLGEWKGLPGLFVAGIFSGALRFLILDYNNRLMTQDLTCFYCVLQYDFFRDELVSSDYFRRYHPISTSEHFRKRSYNFIQTSFFILRFSYVRSRLCS